MRRDTPPTCEPGIKRSHGPLRLSRQLAVGVLCLLAGLSVTPPEALGVARTIAVLELESGDGFPATEAYVQALQQELERMPNFDVLLANQVTAALGSRLGHDDSSANKDLDALESRSQRGSDLIFKRPSKAVRLLEPLLEELDALGAATSGQERLRELWFRTAIALARGHIDRKDTEQASDILQRVYRFFGGKPITVENYHPDLVALYDTAAGIVKDMPRGYVKLQLSPPGAEAFVNGTVTPSSTGGRVPVPAGEVLVYGRYQGATSTPQRFQLAAGETKSVTLDLRLELTLVKRNGRAVLSLAPRRVAPEASAIAASLGRLVGVDAVCIAGLVERNGELQFIARIVASRSERVLSEGSYPAQARVLSRLSVANVADSLATLPEPELRPWYTRWVGWLGVATAIGGATLGTIALDDYQTKKELAECVGADCPSDALQEQYGTEGNDSRILAGVGYGLAAAGVVGAVLGFWLTAEAVDPMSSQATPAYRIQPALLPSKGAGISAEFTF